MPISLSGLSVARPTVSAYVPVSQLAAPAATFSRLSARKLSWSAMAWLKKRVPPIAQLPASLVTLAMHPGGATSEAAGIVADKYMVEQGDWPAKIAEKLTGVASKWPELVNANVPPKTKGSDGNFKTLYAGEMLTIPAGWWPLIQARIPGTVPPGTVPGTTPPATTPPTWTVPGTNIEVPIPGTIPGMPPQTQPPQTQPPTTIPTTTDYPPGMVLQSQMMLAAWAKKFPGGAVSPTYGQTSDFNGTHDMRYSFTLSEFQKWANLNQSAGIIPASIGKLDQATYNAQTKWFAGESLTQPPIIPGTVPGTVPGTIPGTIPGTVPGTVPGTQPSQKSSGGGALIGLAAAAFMFLK